jgi:hypothetical protein
VAVCEEVRERPKGNSLMSKVFTESTCPFMYGFSLTT